MVVVVGSGSGVVDVVVVVVVVVDVVVGKALIVTECVALVPRSPPVGFDKVIEKFSAPCSTPYPSPFMTN